MIKYGSYNRIILRSFDIDGDFNRENADTIVIKF